MTIWRMRIACRITKATNTHSEYLIHIILQCKKWLQERALMLRYTYTACLVCFVFFSISTTTTVLFSVVLHQINAVLSLSSILILSFKMFNFSLTCTFFAAAIKFPHEHNSVFFSSLTHTFLLCKCADGFIILKNTFHSVRIFLFNMNFTTLMIFRYYTPFVDFSIYKQMPVLIFKSLI